MRATGRMRWWWLFLPGLAAIGGEPSALPPPAAAPASPDADALAELRQPGRDALRRVNTAWELRAGPARKVVDQVCLVPDAPTFLRVVATWDRETWFPVLIEDVERTARFLRAFRPGRIVRVPRDTPDPTPIWDRARAAVASSWRPPGAPAPAPAPDGGPPVPPDLGPTPPGLVLADPDAATLAGAVALAAGRFQPLARFSAPHRYADILPFDRGERFCRDVEAEVGARWAEYGGLGDDCDFLTLAGDWAYRLRGADGQVESLDDRVGRSARTGERWAFAGRLSGDAGGAVDRAMCSLFLRPEAALTFNGYSEAEPPWSSYATRLAAVRFSAVVPTVDVSGPARATVAGWHKTFDPSSPYGLLWVNSHGSPTVFHLAGSEPASPADIPRGTPSAVALIHSFSAADFADPDTVAGRWMAQGAFVFYGSVNEPYIDAFRPPLVIAELLADKVPMAAAVRRLQAEPRGYPWRLIYLGDPLYRVFAEAGGSNRVRPREPSPLGPEVLEAPRTDTHAPADARLAWAVDAALARLRPGPDGAPAPGLAGLVDDLAAIRRGDLAPGRRPAYDALVGEAWLEAGRRGDLIARVGAIPPAERSPALRRLREACLASELADAIAADDFGRARSAWSGTVGSDAGPDFQAHATARAGRLADADPGRRPAWLAALRDALRRPLPPAVAAALRSEIRRAEAAAAR